MDKPKEFDKRNVADIIGLTPMQQGMLFHYLKSPESPRYVEQLCLNLGGMINPDQMEIAWNKVIESNEMLRAVYRWEKMKNPVQLILKEHSLRLRYHDFSAKGKAEKEEAVTALKAADRAERFDLRQVPFRITLCRTEHDKGFMLVTNHHILYDGWSNGILLKEFFSTYNDLLEKRQPQKTLKTPFKEFVKRLQDPANKEKDDVFWKNYLLADADPNRGDKNKRRRGHDVKNTALFRYALPADLTETLSVTAKQLKITLSALLTGAWGILLQGYYGERDIIFDTTVAGRSAGVKGIENMVGMCINTLPIRFRCRRDEGVAQLLVRQYEEAQMREAHENTSVADINELLESYAWAPPFDCVLVLENYPLDKQLMQEKGQVKVESFAVAGMTQYDLTLIITIFDGIDMQLTYNCDIFGEAAAADMCTRFCAVLRELIADPGKEAAQIEILSPADREMLIAQIIAAREKEPAPVVPYAAPRNTVEEKLVDVWREVLNLPIDTEDAPGVLLGIDDDFFAFGGHSLKATLLASRIHRDFDVKIPLEEVFKTPTIRGLSAYINGATRQLFEAIPPTGVQEYYELSSVQHRMFALQQLDPLSTAYNVTSIMELTGNINTDTINIFEAAFRKIIARHEIFRTSFVLVNGEAKQQVHAQADFSLEVIDARNGANTLSNEACPQVIESFVRPFDLAQLPLMRGRIARTGENSYLLILDMHHILTDGFSMDKFIREFTALCRGDELPTVTKQYKDFSQWQFDRLATGKLQAQQDYWLNRFAGELPVLNMMTDFPRPSLQNFTGDRVYFNLDKELGAKLHELGKATGTTLFMILAAAYNALLCRYTGQEDIVIGTTVAGRDHPDLENILGLFIETLALRTEPSGAKTFAGYLKEVRDHTLAAYENEEYPFRELIKKTGSAAEMCRNPLFDVMLIVQNVAIAELVMEGIQFRPYPYHKMVAKLDMTLEAVEVGDEIRFHIEYAAAIFKRETMERLACHFVNILRAAVSDPQQRIADMAMLDDSELHQLLGDFAWSHWPLEERNYPRDKRIEQVFEEQAARTPDRVAVVHEEHQITFGQLNEKANQIANILKEL